MTSPKLLALDNTESLIEVVEEVPYVNTTATTSGTTGGVGSTIVEEVLFKETGMSMTVTPTIQEGGMLQIAIDSTYSEVISFFNEIPVVDSRHIQTAFLVEDRHTIVLGGLVQKRRAETDRGIPGLMHLPVVGRLFRSDADDEEQRELLVFITPRIMGENEADAVTERYDQHFRSQRKALGMARDGPQGGGALVEVGVRGRLGDRLIERGHLTSSQLDVALSEQRRAHRPLGEILVSLGFVRESHIASLIAEDLGLDLVVARDVEPDPAAARGRRPGLRAPGGQLPAVDRGGRADGGDEGPGQPGARRGTSASASRTRSSSR